MIYGVLFHKKYDNLFLRFLDKDDVKGILTKLHDGSAGGHFSGETIAHKVLREGYYCPTLSAMHMHMHVNAKYVK